MLSLDGKAQVNTCVAKLAMAATCPAARDWAALPKSPCIHATLAAAC